MIDSVGFAKPVRHMAGKPRRRNTMYDLLLKGGTVVDPSVSLHGVHDVAVQDGKIAHIAPTIPREEATRVIEAAGHIVTPGLIDLHAHVFEGFNPLSAYLPDRAGDTAGYLCRK
jgi:dihydroorotase